MSGQMSDLSDQVYYNTNTVQIRPVQGIPSSNLGGQLTFVIDIAKDEMVLPQSIYLAGRFNFETTVYDTVGSTNTARKTLGMLPPNNRTGLVGCVSSGGICNMFNKLQHEISGLSGSSVVQNVENLAQAQALLRQSFDSPVQSTNNGAADVFNILDGSKSIISVPDLQTYTQGIRGLESPSSFILRNAIKQGINSNREISLSSRLPIAMFQQETKLYQGQHIIRLTVDPDYKRRLVDVALMAGNNTNTVPQGNIPANINFVDNITNAQLVNGAHLVAVNLLDLYMYVEYVKVSERPMGRQLLVFENFNVTQHQCSQSKDNFILPCKPNLLKLIMGFQRDTICLNGAANNAQVKALLNPVGMMGFNPTALKLLRVRYLSDVYPQTDYNMQLQLAAHTLVGDRYLELFGSILSDSYDTVRAYEDYYNAAEFDESVQAMTYQQWLENPVFIFKFCSTSNISSNVEITIDSHTGTLPTVDNAGVESVSSVTPLTNATLYVLYVYRSIVEVEFTEDKADYKVFNVV